MNIRISSFLADKRGISEVFGVLLATLIVFGFSAFFLLTQAEQTKIQALGIGEAARLAERMQNQLIELVDSGEYAGQLYVCLYNYGSENIEVESILLNENQINAQVLFSWEYSDLDADTQQKYEIWVGTIENTLIYEDMRSAPSGTLKGSATYIAQGPWVRLTPASGGSGALEYNLNPGSDFVAEFEFWSGGGTGADAVYLYTYNTKTPAHEDDSSGGYIIAYDEFNDQIQLKYNGTTLQAVPQSNLDDSAWHKAKIAVSGNNFKIFLDGDLKIDYTDITRDRSGNLFGWGARTGGLTNEHRVRNLEVTKGKVDAWNSGQVTSEAHSINYSGSPLSRGVTYYWRVRIFDGYEWSGWMTGSFIFR